MPNGYQFRGAMVPNGVQKRLSTDINLGLLSEKTETGLACATTYNHYVWAYSFWGYSAVTPISQTTIWCLWTMACPY
ncbi:MAG: hypothetical protein IPH88_16780 [Bacteroidales bacterium]|nr:hypothetical protein [Bacteroidales bacterium]